ncbi:uncharacterized protein LOC124712450 [Schistocerca piceifrons]|uniref:uncharacterized protein LOC124712450 n=1 Tax=Schistocerca piceifrons TaxID=274613 RepID=UPI001F5FF0FA|nr:uncharacterized protein LOC124712450 [Schistocerca piceifrons]
MKELEKMGTVLREESEKVGLTISENKTKFMVVGRRAHLGPNHLKIGNLTIQKTDTFKYLGVNINQQNLTEQAKIGIYQTIVKPIVCYAMSVKINSLRWYRHVRRRGENTVIKAVINGEAAGKKPLGRLRMRWKDNTMGDMQILGLRDEDADDRKVWKAGLSEDWLQLCDLYKKRVKLISWKRSGHFKNNICISDVLLNKVAP